VVKYGKRNALGFVFSAYHVLKKDQLLSHLERYFVSVLKMHSVENKSNIFKWLSKQKERRMRQIETLSCLGTRSPG